MKSYYYIIFIFSIVISACSAEVDSELFDITKEKAEQTRAINAKTCSKCGVQYNADIYTSCPNGCQNENAYGYHCSICKKPVSGKNGSCNNCGDNPNRKNVPCTSLTCICRTSSGAGSGFHSSSNTTIYIILPGDGDVYALVNAYVATRNSKRWDALFADALDCSQLYNEWINSNASFASGIEGDFYGAYEILLSFNHICIIGDENKVNEFIGTFQKNAKEYDTSLYFY